MRRRGRKGGVCPGGGGDGLGDRGDVVDGFSVGEAFNADGAGGGEEVGVD